MLSNLVNSLLNEGLLSARGFLKNTVSSMPNLVRSQGPVNFVCTIKCQD